MGDIQVDFREILVLAADLEEAPRRVAPNVKKAVQVTASKIKKDWSAASDRSGLGAYASDISYDLGEEPDAVWADIGPTPGDAGSLGIVEDAPGGVRSAPQHAGRDAAKNNEADFVEGLTRAVSDPI